jgi:hypothetical protein
LCCSRFLGKFVSSKDCKRWAFIASGICVMPMRHNYGRWCPWCWNEPCANYAEYPACRWKKSFPRNSRSWSAARLATMSIPKPNWHQRTLPRRQTPGQPVSGRNQRTTLTTADGNPGRDQPEVWPQHHSPVFRRTKPGLAHEAGKVVAGIHHAVG